MQTEKSRLKISLPLFAILLLAAALRLYHLDYKSISIDEAIGGLYAMEPLHRVLILTVNDVHPPLFYLVHHFWIGLFGSGEQALRSISIFFAILAIYALYRLGSRIFNRKVGLLAAFLLTISPWHIWVSQNARSNSMLLLLVITVIYAFYRLLTSGEKRWYFLYVFFTSISLYTHYFSFMIWISQNLYVLFSPSARNRILKNWLTAQLFIGVGYFFWTPLMISQFLTKSRPMYKVLSPGFMRDLFDILNPYIALSPQDVLFWVGRLVFLGLLVAGCWVLLKRYNRAHMAPPQTVTFADSITTRKILTRLPILFMILMILGGTFFILPQAFELLEQQINTNPVIYASRIKPYHLQQFQLLPVTFYLSALFALAIYFLYLMRERIVTGFQKMSERLSRGRSETEKSGLSMGAFFLINSIVPLLLGGLVSLKSPYLLLRNMVIIIPVYYLVLSLAITSVRRLWARSALLAPVVLLAALSFIHFEEWNTKNDWRSAASVVRQSMRPGDTILLDHLFGKKPFYYYGLETVKPLKRYDARQSIEQIDGDVWFLISYRNKWSARRLLDCQYNRVAEWTFPGTNNKDDMRPVDNKIHLIHYSKSPFHLALQSE